MRIATWNVNSLKARLEKVTWWLDRAKPDVLLMQETKLTDADAPADVFKNVGYELVHHGEGRWNGVAIASRVAVGDVVANFGEPLRPPKTPDVGDDEPLAEARIVSAATGGVRVISLYSPPGRRARRVGRDRPRSPQGQARALGPRAAGDRPRPSGHALRRRLEELKEFLRRAPRAFRHAGELRPDDVGNDGGLAHPRAEPAVGAGHDALASDQPRVAPDALGHEVRVLDEVGRRVEHAGDEHLVVGKLHVLEHPPLVGVPRIRRLERDAAGPD